MTPQYTEYHNTLALTSQRIKIRFAPAVLMILVAGIATMANCVVGMDSAQFPLPDFATTSLTIHINQLPSTDFIHQTQPSETQTGPAADHRGANAVSRLHRLAEHETAQPTQTEIPLPPGLSEDQFKAIPADTDKQSSLSLRSALEKVRSDFRDRHPQDFRLRDEAEPDDDALAQAELIYLQARGEYLDGDYFSSIQTAEKALRFDPRAVPVLRLLAEDYLKTTGRAQALVYYKQILKSDPEDEEALMRIGNAAMDRGQNIEAAEYFGRLLYRISPFNTTDEVKGDGLSVVDDTTFVEDPSLGDTDNSNQTETNADQTKIDEFDQVSLPTTQDETHELRKLDNPGLRYIAASGLGDAFSAMGYRKAAAEAWQIAVSIPEEISHSRIFNREITGLRLRRGTLLRHLGDSLVQLHQYDEALDAYRQAQTLPLTDPTSVLPRMIYVYRIQGRPYAAMEVILNTLQSPRMLSSRPQQLRELLAYLRPLPESKALADAVAQLADTNPDFLPITLAAAAVEPDEQGIARVQQYLADHTEDKHAWNALLPWAEQTGGTERVLKLVLSQKNYDRLFPDEAARKILIVAGRTPDVAKAWESLPAEWRNTTESKLLYSQLRSLLGWGERADAILVILRRENPNDIDILLTQASTFIRGGEFTKARNILFGIKSDPKLHSALLTLPERTYRAEELYLKIGDGDFGVTIMDDLARKAAPVSHEPGAFTPQDEMKGNATTLLNNFDPVDFRIRKAELLLSLQRGDEAENLLKEALRADPKREKAYLLLLRLYGVQGDAGRPDDYREIVGELVRELPDSKAVRLLRASQESAMGRTSRAIAELTNLLREDPDNQEILDLLVSNWIKDHKTADGIRWLERQLKQRPGDEALRNALVRIKIAAGLFDEAVAMLKDTLKINSYDESTASELASVLHRNSKDEESRQVRLDRLEHRPPSVERSVLLANLAIDDNRNSDVPPLLKEAVARATGDMSYHLDQLIALARKYRESAPDDHEMTDRLILAMVTEADHEGEQSTIRVPIKISLYGYRAWFSAIAQLGLSSDDFSAIVTKLRTDYPDGASTVIQLTKDELEKADRTDAACVLVDDYLRDLPDKGWSQLDVALVDWRVIKATERKEVDLAIELAKRFDASGRLAALIAAGSKDSPLTNYLYQRVANNFFQNNDNESYEKVLREILKIQPDHAGASNDLGYTLADHGKDMGLAAKMILRAYQSDPSNNAYIDSLGWLRYKQGRFTDQGTEPTQWGAVTLLKKAVENPDGRNDPVILNHYADALWREGNHDEAVKTWKLINTAYDTLISQAKQGGDDQVKAIEDLYHPVVEEADAKILAVANGDEPQTSPLANGE